MLTGAVIYLLEWVAIIGSGSVEVGQLTAVLGRSEADTIASYQGREDALLFMAAWFSVVLLGRILLIVGLKASLAASDRPHALMEFAVAAMTVSVVIEVAAYGLVAAAAQLGAAHPDGLLAVEWSAGALLGAVAGAVGASVLCSAWAMWRSGLFPIGLSILGIAAGAGMILLTVLAAAPFDTASNVLGFSPFAFWLWMLWTGVVLWIRTPRDRPALANGSA